MKTPSPLTVPALVLGFVVSAWSVSGADASQAPGAAAPTAAKTETPAPKSAPTASAEPADLKTPAAATPENAAVFLGDWSFTGEGPNGPAAMDISLKNTAGKITGELSSEVQTSQTFAEIVRVGSGLVMRYNFDYQGMAIDAEVTFTPAGGKMNAKASFAGGAFVVDGSATKKAK